MLRFLSLLLVSSVVILTGCDHQQQPPAPVQPGSWITLGTYTGAAHFLVSINGKLYAGLSAQGEQNPTRQGFKRLVSFDPLTGTASEQAAFPGEALSGFSYFVLNNKLYAGFGSDTIPSYQPYIEHYNPYVYVYDPAANNWQKLLQSSVLDSLTNNGPRLREATSFTYKDRGVTLFGTYRVSSLTPTANNTPVAYKEGIGWGKNKITIPPTPAFPGANSDLVRYLYVFRRGGFGFVLNDRVYTGGGRAFAYGVSVPDEIVARSLYGFTATETADGKGLDLTLDERIVVPSADIDLTNASQAFVLNNKAYIISSTNNSGVGGSLISFTPNEWRKVQNVPEPLRFGAGLNNRAYFLTDNKLLTYVPE